MEKHHIFVCMANEFEQQFTRNLQFSVCNSLSPSFKTSLQTLSVFRFFTITLENRQKIGKDRYSCGLEKFHPTALINYLDNSGIRKLLTDHTIPESDWLIHSVLSILSLKFVPNCWNRK